MAESYIIVGVDTEKIRGLVAISPEEHESTISGRRDKVCKAITAALIATDQPEQLEIVPVSDLTGVEI